MVTQLPCHGHCLLRPTHTGPVDIPWRCHARFPPFALGRALPAAGTPRCLGHRQRLLRLQQWPGWGLSALHVGQGHVGVGAQPSA